jgi:FSR family fosmidomycin resistance protein-like MFS transporter
LKSRALIALCLGHFVGDSYTTFLAPLLPLLMERHGLGLSQAGGLVALLSLSTHLAQPAWGYVADRWPGRSAALFGPVVAAIGMSALGVAANMVQVVLALVLGGMGMAAFHPQAASLARASSGPRRAFGMSLFISSGNLGFALGPVFATGLVASWGLPGTAWAVLPGLAGFALMLSLVPKLGAAPAVGWKVPKEIEPLPWGALVNCFAIATLRAVVSVGFLNFLPILVAAKGLSVREGGFVITVFLLAGAAGGVAGGYAAERWGHRRVMGLSLAASAPFLLAASRSAGLTQLLALSAGGALLVASHPININLAQSLAPARASMVAAFMIGFAVGVAGLTMPLVGALAEARGIAPALGLVALAPLAAAACVPGLPAPRQEPETERVAASVAVAESIE